MADSTQDNRDGRIVVGVDGSKPSKEALQWAAHQAKLTGASLRAVMTWNIPVAAYGGPVPLATGFDFGPEAERILRDTIKEVLGDHAGINVSAVVVEGHPGPALVEEALGADLLVVGNRGHGAFTGMLLGSVSEYAVAHAKCPVVVVRGEPLPSR